jgi:hypothetical protein
MKLKGIEFRFSGMILASNGGQEQNVLVEDTCRHCCMDGSDDLN